MRHAPMAVAARGWATEDTVAMPITGQEPLLVRPAPSTDPLDALVAEIHAGSGGQFVDGLQLAALLEAQGVTDHTARVQYGFRDVFELAAEARTRLAELGHEAPRRPARPRRRGQAVRELLHGALYLLPSVLFPAVLAIARPHPPVPAIVAAGLLGWVWAGGMTWMAYQYLNAGEERAAGRFLALAAAVGVGVAGLIGAGSAATGAGAIAALLVPAAVAYQLASTVLLFFGDEAWLVALMVPAVLAGGAFLLDHRMAPAAAIVPALVCVAVTFGVALSRALHVPGERTRAPLRTVMRGRWARLALVVAYTGLLAALVLQAQVPYLVHHFDILVTALPLVVSMGFVEWRARRFDERSRDMLHDPWGPRRFRRRLWGRLGADVAACWLVAAAAAGLLLAALRQAGSLTPSVATMAAANVVLAGACFLVFVLAGHGGYGRLCLVLAVALGAYSVAPGPFAGTTAFLGTVTLLSALLAVALTPSLGTVRHYR
ncbi:hypothetical protein GCM10010170_109070 [Dactylosporangium salmoneum]|uniref:Integral membrane protein n=2 Tax=Dactylosporangium salmoneum TaxID=53361 RepID=A0ABP5V653_9ACTN